MEVFHQLRTILTAAKRMTWNTSGLYKLSKGDDNIEAKSLNLHSVGMALYVEIAHILSRFNKNKG